MELTSPNANNYLTIDSKYQSTFLTPSPSDVTMDSPSPIEIISIDVPDTVLRKNIQNAGVTGSRHVGLEEAREKFINALVAENGNGKHLTTAKAAYPGLAKQIIATETGESQILDEVGFVDDDRRGRKRVVRVQPRSSQVEQASPSVATSSNNEDAAVQVPKSQSVEPRDLLDENITRTAPEDDTLGLTDGEPADRKSSVSSSGVPVSVDNSGRHECALSDFSIDKEDYRLTRYGLDAALDDEAHEQSEDPAMGEQPDRQEGVEFGENFPNDSARCSNTQVLVLVSAMIHNPFEKEGAATLILEENRVHSKGEITIFKGESDGSIDKVLLVQSPVPSSVSDESTVKIQEIVDDPLEPLEPKPEDQIGSDETSNKRDVNLEIDGKYLKSVVNSRKSPRKTKNGQMRVHSEDAEKQMKDDNETEQKNTDSYTQSEETFYQTLSETSSKISFQTKSPRKEGKSSRSQKSSSVSKTYESAVSDERSMTQYYTPLKGSLDSMIVTSDSRTVSRRRAKANETF